MRPAHLVAQDAVVIRGVLDLFEGSETVTTNDVAMTQLVSRDTARRLLMWLEAAGVIERPTKEADILGVTQRVPCLGWQLTAPARRGEIPEAEDLARGMA